MVDFKIEVLVLPVSDVDRAKDFYKRLGFREDVDYVGADGLRVVHFTPPGSAAAGIRPRRSPEVQQPPSKEQAMYVDNDSLFRDFVETFNTRDGSKLAPFLHPDVTFQSYGDDEVKGRDAVVRTWTGILRSFGQVKFEAVNQAVNGDVVLAEQIHGLALPGGKLAQIMNLAVYEIRDGKIAAWRDYSNPEYARKLLQS